MFREGDGEPALSGVVERRKGEDDRPIPDRPHADAVTFAAVRHGRRCAGADRAERPSALATYSALFLWPPERSKLSLVGRVPSKNRFVAYLANLDADRVERLEEKVLAVAVRRVAQRPARSAGVLGIGRRDSFVTSCWSC